MLIYVDGDNGSDARHTPDQRPGITTASLTPTDAANTSFNGPSSRPATPPATISSSASPRLASPSRHFGTASDNKRAPVNGLQIIPTTPPTPDFTVG
jgi:hypothetical protein